MPTSGVSSTNQFAMGQATNDAVVALTDSKLCASLVEPSVELSHPLSNSTNWQKTFGLIRDRNKHILEKEKFCDCQFLVGNIPNQRIIRAHKLLLASASSEFEFIIFANDIQIEIQQPIPIPDVDPNAFVSMLKCIYTDNIEIKSNDEAGELFYLSFKYMLPNLSMICSRYLSDNLSVKNCLQTYEMAKIHEAHVLKALSMKFIAGNTKEILADRSFHNIKLFSLLDIFDMDILKISSEMDLFYALCDVKRNLSKENDYKNDWLRQAVKKVRFLTLTLTQFAEGPARMDLLTKEEIIDIMKNLESPPPPSAGSWLGPIASVMGYGTKTGTGGTTFAPRHPSGYWMPKGFSKSVKNRF